MSLPLPKHQSSLASEVFKVAINPSAISLPIYSGRVSAGQSRFPSPAQDYEMEELDLNKRFITNPPATFMFIVSGDSMSGVGIYDGSHLIVNRAVSPKSSHIVVAVVEGELMVKRLYQEGSTVKLLSENPAYPSIALKEGQELTIWGVVSSVINELI